MITKENRPGTRFGVSRQDDLHSMCSKSRDLVRLRFAIRIANRKSLAIWGARRCDSAAIWKRIQITNRAIWIMIWSVFDSELGDILIPIFRPIFPFFGYFYPIFRGRASGGRNLYFSYFSYFSLFRAGRPETYSVAGQRDHKSRANLPRKSSGHWTCLSLACFFSATHFAYDWRFPAGALFEINLGILCSGIDNAWPIIPINSA